MNLNILNKQNIKGIPNWILIGGGIAVILWLTGAFPDLHSNKRVLAFNKTDPFSVVQVS